MDILYMFPNYIVFFNLGVPDQWWDSLNHGWKLLIGADAELET